jgi:glycosyltransferase involved in cell wall biosynthesis
MSNPLGSPLISVVIPIHNGAEWLSATLDSILSQTYQQFEIILVNDASTDHLIDVLTRYTDVRLRVEHVQHNVGVSAARNHAIALALGQFIAFCDADDICEPTRLAAQLAFFDANPRISLSGSAFTCFDGLGVQATISHPLSNDAIRRGLMQGNCFGLSTVMARASVLRTHLFDANLRVAEDYDLWTRIAADGFELANIPESLVRYRLHAKQASGTHSAALDQVTRKIRAHYCAQLLNNPTLLTRIKREEVNIDVFQLATDLIKRQTAIEATEFRFMLAWLYQKLPSHGFLMLHRWMQARRVLNLKLDLNYLINITLLACLPNFLKVKYFSTLIKLKR